MSAKTTYVATTPDGTTRSRVSARPYTHASWVRFPDEQHSSTIGFHASEANALKTMGGQSGAQTRYFKSLPHGVVPVTAL